MAAPYFYRRLHIAGKMHIQTTFGNQACLVNRFHIFPSSPMIQVFRRNGCRQSHIDQDGMSLIRPNQSFILIERIPLLTIRLHNLLQHFHIKRSRFPDSCYQFLHIRPTMLIQCNSCRFRFVTQNQTDILTGTV